jgi:hypothetical protein
MEEEKKMASIGELRALLKAIQILNRIIRDPDKLDENLTEIMEALEKGVTPRLPSQ